ncbi:hypothetical protein NPIL_704721 [Nephila pilipes]|uniref:Uncharacterized protein n=1 Tax=Nephila pilipes TaxID=299642 RepID=A0A8X6NGQ3_NEPPI|nr:hypothetical protein NPIL_704721 [Nephila pilipes]
MELFILLFASAYILSIGECLTFQRVYGENIIFNMKNSNDFETIRNMPLGDSDDDDDIVLDESNSDEEKDISGREDDKESQ